jgi:hypothetical protein
METHDWVLKLKNAIGSDEHAIDTDGGSNPENLWYTTQRIRRVLGISIDPKDRSIRSINQRGTIVAGQPIPVGYNFGQWGEHIPDQHQLGTSSGARVGMRDGIAIESIPNRLVPNPFKKGQFNIASGDYVLCENFPQLLAEIIDQLDKSLDLQSLGASAIPNADGSGKIATYEGLGDLLNELAFTLSKISQATAQTQVSSMITQGMGYEILLASGVPTAAKSFPMDTGGNVTARVPYPGIALDAPTVTQQLGWIVQNLSILVAHSMK